MDKEKVIAFVTKATHSNKNYAEYSLKDKPQPVDEVGKSVEQTRRGQKIQKILDKSKYEYFDEMVEIFGILCDSKLVNTTQAEDEDDDEFYDIDAANPKKYSAILDDDNDLVIITENKHGSYYAGDCEICGFKRYATDEEIRQMIDKNDNDELDEFEFLFY